MRIPVVSVEEKPLMPTTPTKARKLIRGGVAEKRWNKLGMFYIQMIEPVGDKVQDMSLAIDPGSKYDGYAVASEKEVSIKGMAILPHKVQQKITNRRQLRRARRYRNTRRRPCRFDNRRRDKGWIAPSQKAKIQLRFKIVKELFKIYPIKQIIVEDVRFNHYKKRWGKYFSTVEIGKNWLYSEIEKLTKLVKYDGWETSVFREEYNIKKCSDKTALKPESHANDAVAMICGFYNKNVNSDTTFWYWQRLEPVRRSLHRQNFQKGGIRSNFGGTAKDHWLRKGDYVEAKQGDKTYNGWVVGIAKAGIGVADEFGKRLCQASEKKVILICRNKGVTWANSSRVFRRGNPSGSVLTVRFLP